MKRFLILVMLMFGAGIGVGGYLFSDTQPRAFLEVGQCQGIECLDPKEIMGLAGSVGIQRTANLLPFVEQETDKTVLMRHPFPLADIHYVAVPKKDIKDPSQLTDEDKEYLADAFAVMGAKIREEGLKKYKIITNGPGYQSVGYLHFHLVAEKE
ncbi:MAG: hypothetical protein A3E07_00230 [Candidatus Wildermuthbacteria bacterium RIFCSPHIGHO2_12_FULL_45_9]|uniref:HIT domain-containing protein n=1 Tax=Candidatus Wildermuthbacteria bacterium RIFCSPHIGHO2_02_FULL_45_25 TaxID=1802450 RepID=A0A1G2QZ43_9BACT|nr:MAG: hypothetical protein A2748_02170 [Candidatus Wildermuthbacteria bacterium RIFCSPHIGHO2_01_FULL_45_20]OHA65727.1 MAG: hypothetical protein A3C04_02315 [Candidatus Wildermuthbacteria bacterium RIFCSPHIGHO2_02_FULL_45_25]OHA70684.1 MAG: hypothetical protein A3E07_00230 [Candidatus Wildermuthbacteria bacterium RIFCSPHIGHO2_12_FULL_45_9]